MLCTVAYLFVTYINLCAQMLMHARIYTPPVTKEHDRPCKPRTSPDVHVMCTEEGTLVSVHILMRP